jgi:hypothetical protein
VVTNSRIPILICGDAGPARNALLARRDLEVLWADTIGAAVAIIRETKPRVCITRYRLRDGDATDLVAWISGRCPCLVLLGSAEWTLKDRVGATGAEVMELGRGRGVLARTGEIVGVDLGVARRVPFESVVEVEIKGARYILETTDLSSSGIGIKGLPAVPRGTPVRVRIHGEDEPIAIQGVVARHWTQTGELMGGVEFTTVTPGTTRWLERATQPRQEPIEQREEALEEERFPVSPLAAMDLAAADLGALAAQLEDRDPAHDDLVRQLHAEEDVPDWIAAVASTLTAIERSSLLAPAAPLWTRVAIQLRLELARHRNREPHLAPVRELSDRAYQFFVRLASVDPTDAYAPAIGAVRAAILRDLLSSSRYQDLDGISPEAETEDLLLGPRQTSSGPMNVAA